MYKHKKLLKQLGLSFSLIASGALAQATEEKPNFLLIVADDLGYSDIGSFGGEIKTPNLDDLASQGVRFTDFHTAPTCSPTRAMLLTSTDSHQAGIGNMAELLLPSQKGQPGYEGYLNDRVATLPEVLRDGGYSTYMTGKWHLGRTEDRSPAARGFDKSYVLVQGGASHFDDQRAIIGADPVAIYRENGKQVDIPDGFFSSDFFTDRLIQYIDEDRSQDKPFFAFLAFTAPHWPLQAPDEYLEKYEGWYEEGYEAVRQERLQRMKLLGLIDNDLPAHTPMKQLPTWDELTPEQQRTEAKRMQVYAAMVDNMDHNIGRILAYLDGTGELDNTVVVFMSDNGADGNSPEVLPKNEQWIAQEYDNSFENMGRKNSYIWYGAQWGQVGATPYPMYKAYPSQGGLLSPFILNIPGQKDLAGTIDHDFAHVMDIMPTFMELAGLTMPKGASYKGRNNPAPQGVSMLRLLGEDVHNDRAVGWELIGRSAVRKGDWKIRLMEPPYGPGEWELFNLAADPTETTDLADSHPDKLKELLAAWDQYVQTNGVIPSDPEKMKKVGYSFTTCLYGRCVE